MNVILICQIVISVPTIGQPLKKVDSDDKSIEIRATHFGWFARKSPWKLEVGGEGKAKLRIGWAVDGKERDFVITTEKLRQFKDVLAKEKFFELPNEIGVDVDDGDERTLQVKIGKQEKIVKIKYLTKDHLKEAAKLDQARRSVRVWAVLRGLFEDNDAYDGRPVDEEILR